MAKRVERERMSILCPERGQKSVLLCEWEVEAAQGRILKRRLKQIDCHNPDLPVFGGAECHWGCEEVIRKREK